MESIVEQVNKEILDPRQEVGRFAKLWEQRV